MANVRGLRDLDNRNNDRRNDMRNALNPNIAQPEDRVLQEEMRENRIPFITNERADRPPL